MLSVALFGFRVLGPSTENWNDPYVVRWNRLMVVRLILINHPPFGESASPFIDEGDGLTSEREGVCAT